MRRRSGTRPDGGSSLSWTRNSSACSRWASRRCASGDHLGNSYSYLTTLFHRSHRDNKQKRRATSPIKPLTALTRCLPFISDVGLLQGHSGQYIHRIYCLEVKEVLQKSLEKHGNASHTGCES